MIMVPTRQDTEYIQQNDLTKFEVAQPEVAFLQLEKKYVDSLIEINQPFQVVLIASWCVHCFVALENGTYKRLKDSLKPMPTFIVNTNDNAAKWNKFKRENLPDTIYFLSAEYGLTEREKIFEITKQLCDTCELRYSLPQYFSVNQN
jgi:hypothetical protein